MAVSNNNSVILSTYALGSCIGVIAYDPFMSAGGILHFMLPDSKLSPEKASARPSMFGDSGMKLFFRELFSFKAENRRLRVVLTGGASVLGKSDMFKIGTRNADVARDFLRTNRLNLTAEDTGGLNNRTVHLELRTGNLTIKLPTGTKSLCLK